MKNTLFIVIALADTLLQLTSCSRNEAPVPTAERKTTIERIAEIDAMLAVPPSGTIADADRRAALRAERNALSGGGSNARAQTIALQQANQASYQAAQDARERQQMVDRVRAEAE